ncbi:MAG TPA: hypothetical protein VF482_19650 [Trebonia sp.]
MESELAALRDRYERELNGYRAQLTFQRLELERARRVRPPEAAPIPQRRAAPPPPGAGSRLVAGPAGCTLVRVRCFTVPAPAPGPAESAVAPGSAQPATDPLAALGSDPLSVPEPPEERYVRLAFERRVVPAPADRFGEIAAAATGPHLKEADHDREDRAEGLSERLADATADYLGAKAGDPLVEKATQWWVTRDSYPETSVADVLTEANKWLHGLVEHPLEGVAERVSIPAPGASLAAGIAAEVVLQPVAEPMTKLTEFRAIAGLVVGLATGAHPLVVSSVKVLTHDAVDRALGEVVKQGFREIGIIRPASDLDSEAPRIDSTAPGLKNTVDDVASKRGWILPGIGGIGSM